MTHDSTMTTTAPVLRNRSREWFSQQASGPLQLIENKNVHVLQMKIINN